MAVETQRLKGPQQLYEDWEHAHWAAQDVDLSRDPGDWAALEGSERDLLYWVLSSLMVAEERISTQFCGLVLAQDDEEEGSYLSTQLVDEVRHMQFYARFQNEVIADPAVIGAHVARAREVLGDPFRKVFDEALVNAHDRLCRNPGDREAKVDFVTTYHMVIEGTLALTGQFFITDFLEKQDLLPGFLEGFRNIAQDEHRHVAYGTWYLQQAAKDPALRQRIQDKLMELIPVAAGVLVPPGADPENFEILGYSSEETNTFAFRALSRRLKVIGVDLAAAGAAAA